MKRALAAAVLAAGLAGAGPAPATAPAAGPPRVLGPRSTTSTHPVYRFRAPGATGFRCAFDSVVLHRCRARYSQELPVGAHVLRVRAVRRGKLSAIVSVRVVVNAPPAPSLVAARVIDVAPRPGAPAVAAGSVWVPGTQDGSVARIDPATGAVTATIAAVAPTTAEPVCDQFVACEYINTAVGSGPAVWVACDFCGEVVRIDAATNQVVSRISVPPRPGGLAVGGGFVWAFHTLGSQVTRIDPSTGAVATFTIPGVEGAGIAFARGSVWLLSSVPRGAVVRLDPQTLAVQARIDLHPVGRLHPFKEAWGLVGDDDRLWVADPNYNTVTEIDPATEAVKRQVHRSPATPMDEPFGIALAGDDVWVAGRNGVTRIDERTGEVVGELGLPQDQYTNVVVGFGAAWVTRFLPATLVKVTPP